jgi:hypothetical protein
MGKVNGRQTTDGGRQVMEKVHIAIEKVSIVISSYKDKCNFPLTVVLWNEPILLL